MFSVYYAYAVA